MVTFKDLMVGVKFTLNGNKYVKQSNTTAKPLFDCHVKHYRIGLNESVAVNEGITVNIGNTKRLSKLYLIFYNANLPTLFSLRSRVNELVWCNHKNSDLHMFLKTIDRKIFTQSLNNGSKTL